jgi:hypothetical protein
VVDEWLSRAVIAYVGEPGQLDALTPEQRVVDVVGDAAVDLVPRVQAILAELDTVDPPLYNVATLAEMSDRVDGFLRERHPELTTDAIQAVQNRYTYDWR